VSATKPLDVAGSLVTGLRIRFEGGRAVEIDADTNAEALRGRCAADDGAARLGEVALVDRESRIGKLGRTFYTTLLDENAASHLAFGDAYSAPIGDPADIPRINESAAATRARRSGRPGRTAPRSRPARRRARSRERGPSEGRRRPRRRSPPRCRRSAGAH